MTGESTYEVGFMPVKKIYVESLRSLGFSELQPLPFKTTISVMQANACGMNCSHGEFSGVQAFREGFVEEYHVYSTKINYNNIIGLDDLTPILSVTNRNIVYTSPLAIPVPEPYATQWTGSIYIKDPGLYTFEIESTHGSGCQNLARSCNGDCSACPASVSSAYDSIPASNAVDGVSGDGTHIHTECLSANEWWMVDLQTAMWVGSVKIYNRNGWFSRISGAEIRVGHETSWDANPTCATNLPGDAVINVDCNAVGRYLFVVQPRADTCLNFEEIELLLKKSLFGIGGS